MNPAESRAVIDAPDVVVVGSASRDIAPEDPRGWRLGGGVSYGGLALARLGMRTGMLVGVDASGADAVELTDARSAGAEVAVAQLESSPVFENREQPDGRIQVCLEPGLPVSREALPTAWRGARHWLLAPVAGELAEAWAQVPPRDAVVALGWQGLLRSMSAGSIVRRKAPQPSALLRRASIVGLSLQDLEPDTRLEDLGAFLGPDVVVLATDAERGGWWLRFVDGRLEERRHYPAISAHAVVDPTGAGDVFLAGYLAARAGHLLAGSGRAGTHLRLAAAAASLTIEGRGMAGVPWLSAVAERLASSLDGPAPAG